ncbi:MAG: 2-amino-4-hydroxy-6-hydroxymethyldihydropteridine diphosphokinase [Marinifilaceae bacterium]|jgi:2-amino-4-hydroxy-6-hydroxymethyldihydropteridine diphosphokinase|nr:2-amino-4-hydroxy-6-hydroxymethyldihydropteridine diphosphokinase [Marinifilaceae bacterium]
MTNTCIISFGSNIDPKKNVKYSETIISSDHQLLDCSKTYITKPIGIKNQDDFHNGAFIIKTNLDKEDFKLYLKQVENQLGRDRSLAKFGPRTIDLDIIIWNNEIVDKDYFIRDFIKQSVDELIDKYNIEADLINTK